MLLRFLGPFILFGIIASFSVYAENHDNGIKYNFAEFRFVDVDGGDGIEFGGSYQINEKFYGFASFQDLDVGPGNASIEFLEIGGGYIYPHKKIDLAFEVGLIDADFPSGSESGFSLAAGGRGYLSPEFEVRAFVRHIDVLDSDTFIELGGDYFLNSNVSIGLTLEVSSDADALTFGGRYYF